MPTDGPRVGPVGLVANDAKMGPKGEPMTPIPSASLMILCPISAAGQDPTCASSYATLVVQRSAKAGGSFRSAVVFPGGLLDQADEFAVAAASSIPSASSVDTSNRLRSSTPDAYLTSLRLCALRETFEETGLLLLPALGPAGQRFSRAVGPSEAGMTQDEWTSLRKDVHDDARAFVNLLKRIECSDGASSSSSSSSSSDAPLPVLAPLRHHSNWVTPRTLVRPAKRFDTHFFLTILNTPDALGALSSSAAAAMANGEGGGAASNTMAAGLTADGSETTSLRLATPNELMSLAVRDEIILFPPQYYLLADVHTTLASTKSGGGDEQEVRFSPLVFGQEQTQEEDNHAHSSVGAPPRLHGVSSVEPQGKPAEGAMIPRAHLNSTGGKYGGGADEVDEEDQVFVLPLTLPGDALRPLRGEAETAHGAWKRNRVYVTPRSKGEGGGMMVHGAHRRGQKGLRDFTFGHIPQEAQEADEPEAHSSLSSSSSSSSTERTSKL